MKYKTLFLALSALLALSACNRDDDDDKPAAPAPVSTYTFSDFETNTQTERQQAANLKQLVTEMQKGRTSGTEVDSALLVQLYSGSGASSLESLSEPAFADSVSSWIARMALSAGNTYNPATAPSGTGGALGGYLFDRYGVEPEQLIEKGAFGAALYYRVLTQLFVGEVSAADIDKAFVYYGADPSFPNNGSDNFTARYAARRDNVGFYTRLKASFLNARAAAASGNATALQAAITAIKTDWEATLAATVINYLYGTASGLAAATTDPQRAAAWHSWSEGVGFLYGLRALPAAQRRLTDAQLDDIMTKMNASYPYTPTSLNSPSELADLEAAIQIIATAYGFADPTLFKINDVTANGR